MGFIPVIFVRLFAALAVGLLVAKWLLDKSYSTELQVTIILATVLSIFLHFRKSPVLLKMGGFTLLLCISVLSALNLVESRSDRSLSDHLRGREVLIQGSILELGETYSNGVVYNVGIDFISDGSQVWESLSEEVKVYVKGAEQRNWLGKQIQFKTKWSGLPDNLNPYQFDYGAYLLSRGVIGQCFVDKTDINLSKSQNISHIQQGQLWLSIWRWKGLKTLHGSEVLSNRTKEVLSALCLGDRAAINDETEGDFVNAGIIHILAVSGLHVGIIYMAFSFILGRVIPRDNMKLIRVLSVLTIMWCYAGITGFSPSVLRASVMFSFIVFGKEWRRKTNIYNSIAASAVVLLIANPKLLFNPGFQLSYSAVIGIVAFYPLINRCWFPPTKWLAYLWNLLCVSLVAQLATLPFSLFYFQQFPTYFWLANLVVIPLIPIILAGGILYLGIAFIPYFSHIWAFTLDCVVQFVLSTASMTSHLPHAVIHRIFIAPWQFVLLIGSLLSALIFVQRAEKKWLVVSLIFAIVVPIGGLYMRFQHSKEIEIVYYAAQNNPGHTSFRIGHDVVVVGDTADTFSWRGLQTSNYVNQVWQIPFKQDTVLPKLNFEKRGAVVYFRNNFYRLTTDRDNSFWYQVAPLKRRINVSSANYKPTRNDVFIIRL